MTRSRALPLSRVLTWMAIPGVIVAIGVLSFGDRASRLSRVLIWRSVGLAQDLGLVGSSRLAVVLSRNVEWLGHFTMWAGAAIVAWAALRHRVSALNLGLGLGIASAAVEYLQPMLSTTRATDIADLEANLLGIAFGLIAVAIASSLASAVATLRRQPTR